MSDPKPPSREPLVLWGLTCVVMIWSGYAPEERTVWLMEVFPVIGGGVALAVTWKRFPFTSLSCRLMFFFALILMIGGKYTYAEVPIGNWFRDTFHLQRNHFDRFGHFFQGVIPAILAREMLLRCTPLRQGKALFWICVSVAVAISAAYELVEWISAITTDPSVGAEFLGAQGDEWDAQKDMLMATCGAMLVQVLFHRVHDRQIEALGVHQPSTAGTSPN